MRDDGSRLRSGFGGSQVRATATMQIQTPSQTKSAFVSSTPDGLLTVLRNLTVNISWSQHGIDGQVGFCRRRCQMASSFAFSTLRIPVSEIELRLWRRLCMFT